MQRASLILVVSFTLSAATGMPTLAGTQDDAKVALHLASHSSKSLACDTWGIPCSEFTTGGALGVPYDTYLIVTHASRQAGIAGLSCGVDYDGRSGYGVDVYSWTFCGTLQFAMDGWPDPGTGNRMTWDMVADCQRGVVPGFEDQGTHAVAGAFYVYAYSNDALSIVQNRLTSGPELAVADCLGNRTDLATSAVGSLHFTPDGTNRGYNPCTGAGDPPPDPSEPPPPPPDPEPRPRPDHNQSASFMLHIAEAGNSRTVCRDAPLRVTDVVTVGGVQPGGALSYVYVLGTPRSYQGYTYGLAALRFGIQIVGAGALQIFSWNSCSANTFSQGDWPNSLSGNTVILDASCSKDEVVPFGYFYLAAYEPATMSLVGFPTTGKVEYTDCESTREFRPVTQAQVGWISLGGAARGLDTDGCNPAIEPCDGAPTPVQSTTWGQLKNRYTGKSGDR